MKKFLSIFNKNKKTTSLSVVLGAMMIISMSAMAAGEDAVVDSMTSAFDGIKTTALLALASIGGIAIVLFGGIYAWKYGKKVFSIIAK